MYGKKKLLMGILVIIMLVLFMPNVVNAEGVNPETLLPKTPNTTIRNIASYGNNILGIISTFVMFYSIINLLIILFSKKLQKRNLLLWITFICIILGIIVGLPRQMSVPNWVFEEREKTVWENISTGLEDIVYGIGPILILITQIIITIYIIKNKMKAKKEGEKDVKNRK